MATHSVKSPTAFQKFTQVAFWKVVSFLSFIFIWWAFATLLESLYFPAPSEVYHAFMRELNNGELIYHLNATIFRVIASFLIAMFIGSVIGIVLGRNKHADLFFDSWLIFFLNMPALVVMVLCYIWFGLTDFAAILAVVINKVPTVAVTVREGARALDKSLEQMAKLYHFGKRKTLFHVLLPQFNPYFMAAARAGLALVWKIVLVVELLGRSNGIGFQIHIAFQTFDVASILAYAFAFIIFIQLIEWCIFKPLEKYLNRWRA